MIEYKKSYKFTCDTCRSAAQFNYNNGDSEDYIAEKYGWQILCGENQDVEDTELMCPICIRDVKLVKRLVEATRIDNQLKFKQKYDCEWIGDENK